MSSRKRMVQDLCDSALAGRTKEVARLLGRHPTIVNEASMTEQGVRMTALLFASGRGHLDVVRCCMGEEGERMSAPGHRRVCMAAGGGADANPSPPGMRSWGREWARQGPL